MQATQIPPLVFFCSFLFSLSPLFLLLSHFGSYTLWYIKMDKYYKGVPARQLVDHYSRPEDVTEHAQGKKRSERKSFLCKE